MSLHHTHPIAIEPGAGPVGGSKLDDVHGPAPPVERMTWRLEEIANALGISRRALERERSAGRFPRPDLTIGRMPLWAPETIRRWVAEGGAR